MQNALTALSRVSAFTQSLRAYEHRISTATMPFWSPRRSTPTVHLAARPFPFTSRCRAAFRLQDCLRVRTFNTSTQSQREVVSSQSNEKSLSWRPIYDNPPVSFGVCAWGGYHQLISPDTPLPCRIPQYFEGALDYIGHDTITICHRRSMIHKYIDIATLQVPGIRKVRKEDTRMKIIMIMERDLTGKLTAHFTPQDKVQRGEVSVHFDGARALDQRDCNAVITI